MTHESERLADSESEPGETSPPGPPAGDPIPLALPTPFHSGGGFPLGHLPSLVPMHRRAAAASSTLTRHRDSTAVSFSGNISQNS